MVAMAFALGRSQAQARMSWVATARTLGVRRSTVAGAIVLETVLVGAVAAAGGVVAGRLIAVAEIASLDRGTVAAFDPDAVLQPWYATAGLLALSLLLAVIVGAIPAFWAARISPVASLKPVNEITEAEVSRRVPIRWVALAWLLAALGLWILRDVFTDRGAMGSIAVGTASVMLVLVVAVVGYVLIQELLRRTIPWIGHGLSRSSRPWVLATGDSLAARPRQAAVPALVMTLAVAVFAVTTLMALAVASASGRATAADSATRSALGMTPAGPRLAAALQFTLPLSLGAVLGWALGLAAAVAIYPRLILDSGLGGTQNIDTAWVLGALPHVTLPVGAMIALAFGAIALGGALMGAFTRTGAPVRDLQRVYARPIIVRRWRL